VPRWRGCRPGPVGPTAVDVVSHVLAGTALEPSPLAGFPKQPSGNRTPCFARPKPIFVFLKSRRTLGEKIFAVWPNHAGRLLTRGPILNFHVRSAQVKVLTEKVLTEFPPPRDVKRGLQEFACEARWLGLSPTSGNPSPPASRERSALTETNGMVARTGNRFTGQLAATLGAQATRTESAPTEAHRRRWAAKAVPLRGGPKRGIRVVRQPHGF
jgi:hypothetical protein